MNKKLRIAIADDEAEMRHFLSRILRFEGHKVVVAAESGRQLIHECRVEKPDLLITDIKMPDIDGLQAIHEICSENVVPSIIVSGNCGDDILIRVANEPVFAFLIKPIKMDDLRPAVWLTMRRFAELTSLQARLAAQN